MKCFVQIFVLGYWLQLSACVEYNKVAFHWHQCKCIDDNEIGKVKSSLPQFKFIIYVISRAGKVKLDQRDFNFHDFDFDVGPKYEQSKGNGLQDVLDGKHLLDWLIKGRLHIFYRTDLRFE